MKKTFSLLLLLFAALCVSAQMQDDPVIFEIGGKPIYKSEFMKDFLHSVGKDPAAAPTACTYEKRKALEDYVDLFVNFRVKLADAYALGMDTSASMLKELEGYRSELSAPYLIDSATLQQILHQAYERNKIAVHAAHILVNLAPDASPADTLKAYNRAMEVYRRVTTGGEVFSKVAKELMEEQMTPEERERYEQHPMTPGHEGDLGFFTVFNMIYPFENAAYTIEPGTIGKPIRSQYGYHVIKVIDRVPFYGNITLRHIWMNPNGFKAEGNIKDAYKKLKDGMDFDRVARNYSDDRRTSDKGGLLGNLSMQQLPPDYISMVGHNDMKAGDISEPFFTEYGWHIIRVDRRDTIPAYEDMVFEYRQNLSHDPRNNAPRDKFVEQCKQRYHLVDYTKEYGRWQTKDGKEEFVKAAKVTKKSRPAATLDDLASLLDESVFQKKWIFQSGKLKNLQPLFSLNGRPYNAHDLGQFIALTQRVEAPMDIKAYVSKKYDEFINSKVLELADKRLEEDNSEFREIMDEYRHGLMIFNYNDAQIWSKTASDTLGFDLFYKEASATHSFDNPEDSVYFWNERARITVYTISDSACLKPDKAVKVIAKGMKKNRSSSDIRLDLLEKVDRKQCRSAKPVLVRLEMVERGNQELLLSREWKQGSYVHPNGKGYEVVVVEQVLPPMLKSKDEARGYYVNDFQAEAERQLVERLRKKYDVKIHQDVIDAITY